MACSRDGIFQYPLFNFEKTFDPLPQHSSELTFVHEIFRAWKMRTDVRMMLLECFNKSVHPYKCCLSLMYHIYRKPSNLTAGSLAETILISFKNWHIEKNQCFRHMLNDSIKLDAFYLGTGSNKSFLPTFIEVFGFTEDVNLFIGPINELLGKHYYREVSVWVTVLKIEGYGLKEILIPSFLQNKNCIINEFLLANPGHQKEFLSFLDDLLGMKSLKNHLDTLAYNMDIPNTATHYLTSRSIKKLLKRLCLKFNISDEHFPKFLEKRELSSLFFLIYERFIHHRMSTESFRELAEETLNNKHTIILEFVSKLVQIGEFKEAIYWSQHYNIPQSELPVLLNKKLISMSAGDSSSAVDNVEESESDWETEYKQVEVYHQLNLSPERVLIIQSEPAFCEMMSELKKASLAGIDSEWKPTITGPTNEPSLLQIALSDRVYLVDLIAVKTFPSLWQELKDDFFMSEHITKLGFSIADDFRALSKYLSDGKKPFEADQCLDLNKLWQQLTNKHNLSLPFFASSDTGYSLSHLVYLCFGKRLDKREQFSNWAARPLRETQKYYAALDAYCLLEVYNTMQAVCLRNGLPFEETARGLMDVQTILCMDKKKYTNWRDEAAGPLNPSPVDVNSLKLVCDRPLVELGKCLRYCGIDTECFRDSSDSTVYVYQEKRFLLTCGKLAIKRFNNNINKNCKMIVKNTHLYEQVREVLAYINVNLECRNLLSRCPECNSDFVVTIDNEEMKSLYLNNPGNGKPSSSSGQERPVRARQERDYDGFEFRYDSDCDEYESFTLLKKSQILTKSGIPMTNMDKVFLYKTFETVTDFRCCQGCGFTFWKDSEVNKMLDFIFLP